jgi:hypothetical protein
MLTGMTTFLGFQEKNRPKLREVDGNDGNEELFCEISRLYRVWDNQEENSTLE